MFDPEVGLSAHLGAASFPGLWSRWTEAKEARGLQIREQRRAVVDHWETALADIAHKQEQLVVQGQWVSGPSTLLSIIGQSRRETYHCRVIAWLMDPTGRHGLGVSFLAGFLESCVLDAMFEPTDLRRATVVCEVVRAHSRADIVIWMPQATVVIEAKTDAIEGRHQCDRLYEDFAEEPDPHFVFLSPRGRPPVTATGDALESFRTVSLLEIIRLIEDSMNRSSGIGVDEIARASVHNYLATLRKEFL